MSETRIIPRIFSSTQRFIITGILTLVPLWITWIIFEFVLLQLSDFGQPAAAYLLESIGAEAEWVFRTWFQTMGDLEFF